MKTFFLKTDKFWIFSRILFTLLFISAVIIVLYNSDFEPRNIFGLSIFGIYIFLMILILFRRAYKKSVPPAVKLITGTLSISVGVLMSYTILVNQNLDELLKIGFHFVPVWIILMGLRDILLHQNSYVESRPTMASD